MIFDTQALFSDAQAITATAASTNYYDRRAFGTVVGGSAALAPDLGKGEPLPLRVQVVEAFNNLTSLAIDIQVDDNSSFSSPTTVATETIALAALKAGKVAESLKYLPAGVTERYVRLYYTVTGTAPTTGKITAGVVAAHQE